MPTITKCTQHAAGTDATGMRLDPAYPRGHAFFATGIIGKVHT